MVFQTGFWTTCLAAGERGGMESGLEGNKCGFIWKREKELITRKKGIAPQSNVLQKMIHEGVEHSYRPSPHWFFMGAGRRLAKVS